jgi:autotransporter-associated beta strand protein
MRSAGGKVRRRLRSLEPGLLGQYFPRLANSAVVEAWQEQGPQQVFRISPLLTRFVALWSVLAFFAADFPVRAATYVWNGSSDLLWTTPANWTTAGVPGAVDIGSFALSAGTATYLNSSTSALGLSFVGAGTVTLLGGNSGLAGSGTLNLGASGLTLDAAAGTVTFGAAGRDFNLGLSANSSFNNNSSSDLLISGGVTSANFGLTLGGVGSGMGTISGTLALGTGTVTKNGLSTWVLGGVNTYTGATTLTQGALRLTNASALGTTAGITTVSGAGAALQLALNGGTLAEFVTLNGSGINSAGAIQAVQGANTISGSITLTSASFIGAAAGASLTLSGSITGAQALTLAGEGTITLGTVLAGTTPASVTKIGTGTLNWQSASTTYTGALTVNAGTAAFLGAGSLGATTAVTVQPGATLSLDSTATNANNRLGARPLSLGGNLLFTGNAAAATAETIGALTPLPGNSVLTLTAGAGQQANFAAASIGTVPTGATFLLRGSLLGGTASAGTATFATTTTGPTFLGGTGATGTTTKGILPWAIIDTTTVGTGVSFATMNSTGVNTGSAGAVWRPLAANEYGTTLALNNNVLLSTGTTQLVSLSINSLNIASGGSLTLNPFQTLTLQSGGLLLQSGNNGIAGGTLTSGASSLWVYTPAASTSTQSLTSTLTGAIAFTKAGNGILSLDSVSSAYAGLSGNVFAGQTTVNEGTLKLGASNALGILTTLPNLMLNAGGITGLGGAVDLNGKSLLVGTLFSQGAAAGAGVAGGRVFSSTGTGALASIVSNNMFFAGNLDGGSVGFLKGGAAANTLTLLGANSLGGPLQVSGGGLTLLDAGTFSQVSSVAVNYATLTLDNTGLFNSADRLSNSAAVTLRGGALTYRGRAATASTETLGSLLLAEGLSTLTLTPGGTNVNSLDLTFASLSLTPGAVLNLVPSGTFGLAGSGNPRINLTSAPTLTNSILPNVVVNGAEFASWIPYATTGTATAGGLGALGTAGFAAYTTVTAGSILADSGTSNAKVTTFTGTQTLPGSRNLNSLNLLTTGAATLAFGAGNLLNLTSGGLLRSGNFTASIGASADSGSLTAGGAAGSVPLYLYNNQNILTLNSRIINNPAGGALQLVLAGAGGVTLASGSNSYTGGTVVDAIPLTLAATGRLPSGGLTLNGANFTQTAGGVIDAANVITLNGTPTVTLAGANTLAGLSFNNTGGGATAPTLNTGSILTLTGGITATSSNPASSATVSAASVLDFGTLAANISAGPVLFNGADLAPLVPSLILAGGLRGSGGLNLTGNGVLQLGLLSPYTGTTTVSGSSALQIGATGAGSPQSQLILADAGSRLNLNNFSTVLGGVSGAGVVTNSSANAQTLTTGYDSSSGTFAGSFARFSDAYASTLNITKVGTGILSLTGTSTSAGALVVNQGGITYIGTGRTGFLANTLAASSSLILDNAITNTNNRLGGNVVTGATGGTLTLGGGSLTIIGNASAPTVESLGAFVPLTGGSLTNASSIVTVVSTAGLVPGMVVSGTAGIPATMTTILAVTSPTTFTLSGNATASITGLTLQAGTLGTLTPSAGGSTITLAPNAAQSLAFYTGAVSNVLAGASILLRGGSLGATLGTGVANLVALTASPTMIGGGGAAATATMSIRPDILADTSATGFGTGFATYVGAAGTYSTGGTGFRPLVATSTASTELASFMTAGNTANIGLLSPAGGYLSANTTINSLSLASGAAFTMAGQFPDSFVLTPTSGGILATGGTSTLSGGQIASPTAGMFFWTPGASTVLNLNSTVTGSNAFTKDGAGNLVVGVRQLYTGATNLNGGTLTLSGGDNRLFVNGLGTGYALNVNAGVLDLGTTSQTVAALSNSNATPGSGGTITGGSSAVFTATAAGVFAGMLAGSLNFTRAGNSTTTLVSDNTFTGATVIRGGVLTLQQGGRLSATSSVTNYFGTLNLDNTTSAIWDLGSRINAAAPLTLQGATVTYTGYPQAASSGTLGAVSLLPGLSTITATRGSALGNGVLTLAGLTRAPGSMVNFTAGSGTLGNAALGNSQILLSSGSGLTNGILGGWALANTTDFATYLVSNGTVAGIGPLGGSGGYSGYSTKLLSSGTVLSSDNILMSSTGTLVAGGTTANALKITNTTTLTISASNTLTLASGGLIAAGAATLTGGTLTSGTSELFLYTPSTLSISSVISGAGMALVKSGAAALTFTGANTYTGTTYVNQNTLTLNTPSANGTSVVAIPGDLSLNGGNVTLSAAGQIATASNITLNGAGSLILAGNNTLNGNITFANPGGTANPVLALGAGTLTLGGTLFASNDVLGGALQPTISGTSPANIKIAGNLNINVSGLAPLGLDILATAPILGAGGLTKLGNGGLRLLATNNAYTGATALNAGVLFLGAANVIPDFSTFTMAAGSTLDLNAFSEAISQLSGAGTVTNNGASQTLTFGLNNADTAFSGGFNAYSLRHARQPEHHQGGHRRAELHRHRERHRDDDHQRRFDGVFRRCGHCLRHEHPQQRWDSAAGQLRHQRGQPARRNCSKTSLSTAASLC